MCGRDFTNSTQFLFTCNEIDQFFLAGNINFWIFTNGSTNKPKRLIFSMWSLFLIGAFLVKRVDYSHGFSSVFSSRTPDLTKIILPKVLQNFKLHLLAQETEPKSFPHNIQGRTRPKGPPFSFLALRDCFSGKKFPKGTPLQFFGFCDRLGIEKSQKDPPFNFFGVVRLFSKKWCCRREYFETLMPFCYFWALDVAPTWASPGFFASKVVWDRVFVNKNKYFIGCSGDV